MARQDESAGGVAPLWLGAYLLAVLAVGIAAGLLLYRHEIGGEGAVWRLLPILLVGELVVYLATLIVPGERVVPPANAIVGVISGLGVRALMAFLTAAAIRLGQPALAQGEVMMAVYARYWVLALLQVLLVVLYLWLIRGALEEERLKPPVRRARAQAQTRAEALVEETDSVEDERRQRLLTALRDDERVVRPETDAPPPVVGVAAPPPTPPIAAPSGPELLSALLPPPVAPEPPPEAVAETPAAEPLLPEAVVELEPEPEPEALPVGAADPLGAPVGNVP